MNGFVRVAGRIVLILVPIIFFIVLLRITYSDMGTGSYQLIWNADHTYVEEIIINRGDAWLNYNDMFKIFSNFPDLYAKLNQIADSTNIASFIVPFAEVEDAPGFFVAVGNFFGLVGSVFGFVGEVLIWPFEVLGWLFSWLL